MVEVQENRGDFSIFNKFADIEERQKILKERVLAFGESFVKNKDEISREITKIKDQLKELNFEIEKIKELMSHLLDESGNLARKEELVSMQRFFNMWEPLKFVKEEEVRKIIKEELSKKETKDIKM